MTDHSAPPRGPDGQLDLGIPRNEEGVLQPTSWMQVWRLWLGMLTKSIPPEPAIDTSKLPPTLSVDEIVCGEPHMTRPTGKWWEETKEKTSIAYGVPEEYLFPEGDEESRKAYLEKVGGIVFEYEGEPEFRKLLRDSMFPEPPKRTEPKLCDECPGVGECDDESMPEECLPKCEHGHTEGYCPWPVGECEHAAPEDYVYFECQPGTLDADNSRYLLPKVKMKRTNTPTYEGSRFVGYETWKWEVYCLAKPREDPITGEVTWEDDPSTMATWED
jgi:hypothetical protein